MNVLALSSQSSGENRSSKGYISVQCVDLTGAAGAAMGPDEGGCPQVGLGVACMDPE